MLRFLLFITSFLPLSLGLTISLLAQTTKPENPLNTLLDSARICFEKKEMKKGLSFAKEAYELAQKENNQQALLSSRAHLASFYFETGMLDNAQQEHLATEALATALHDTLRLIKSISGQANILSVQGKEFESLMLNQKAKTLAHGFDSATYYGIVINMAIPSIKLGHYEEAMAGLLEAMAYYERTDNKHPLAIINNILGELYRENLHNYELANKHYFQAIALNSEIPDPLQLSKNYNNLGINFKAMGQTDSALFYLSKAKEIKEKIGDRGGLAISNFNIGELYSDAGSYRKAIGSFKETLRISQENGITIGLFYAHHGLGKAYLGLKKNNLALDHFNEAKQVSNSLNDHQTRLSIMHAFFEYHKQTGNHLAALQEMEVLQSIKDSTNQVLMDEGFTELRTVYEKELSKKENSLLKAQQAESQATIAFEQKVRHLFIALLLLLMVVLIILYIAFRQRQLRLKDSEMTNYLLKKQNQQLEEQEKKLKGLNSMKDKILSVLGHDIRSPLSTIVGIIPLLEDDELPREMKSKFFSLVKKETEGTIQTLENILDWSRSQIKNETSEKELLDVNKLFKEFASTFELQAYHKKIELTFSAGPSSYLIGNENQLKSVLRNLISNAMKFSNENSAIKIVFSEDSHFAEISVEDNGKGITDEVMENLQRDSGNLTTPGTKGEKGMGIGLKLVKEFVAQNGGSLKLERNEAGGTTARIRFPKTEHPGQDTKPLLSGEVVA